MKRIPSKRGFGANKFTLFGILAWAVTWFILTVFEDQNIIDSSLKEFLGLGDSKPTFPLSRPFLAYKTPNGQVHITRDDAIKHMPSNELLLFARISKTSSTSIMNFLRFGDRGLVSAKDLMPNKSSDYTNDIYECMFVPRNEIRNNSKYPEKNEGDDCPHVEYLHMKEELLERFSSSNDTNYLYVHPFTMVRNPFDRLVSFFYYMQWAIPEWTASEAQDKLILSNDFPGWIEKLHQEFGTDAMEKDDPLGIPYQHEALHHEFDTAVSLIKGEDPEVLVLISECTEASMRLLAEKKPQFFDEKAVEQFLRTSEAKANGSRSKNTERPFNVTHMKDIHKRYFQRDWEFYAIAVEQFIMSLQGSNLKQSEIDECIKKLQKDIII